jgi:mRNA interferase RelE/StbE
LNQYRIFETDNFIGGLEKIRGRDKLFIENKLKTKAYPGLKVEPHYGNNIKMLKNYYPETWRYRIGNYRAFYEISENEKIVYMIGLSTRQNAY